MDISNPIGGIGWQAPSSGNVAGAEAITAGDDWFASTDFSSYEPISPSVNEFPLGASVDHIAQSALSFIVQTQG